MKQEQDAEVASLRLEVQQQHARAVEAQHLTRQVKQTVTPHTPTRPRLRSCIGGISAHNGWARVIVVAVDIECARLRMLRCLRRLSACSSQAAASICTCVFVHLEVTWRRACRSSKHASE